MNPSIDPALHLPPAPAGDPPAFTPQPDRPALASIPGPAVPRPQYEFDEAQNRVIDDLAGSMLWVSAPLLLLGIAHVLVAGYHFSRMATEPGSLAAALLAVLIAGFLIAASSWLRKAASSFDRVTHTTGYDITHLMRGLEYLRRMFGLLSGLVKVYLVVLVLSIAVILVLRPLDFLK